MLKVNRKEGHSRLRESYFVVDMVAEMVKAHLKAVARRLAKEPA